MHGVDVDAVRADLAERDAIRRELGVEPGESLAVTVANLRAGQELPGAHRGRATWSSTRACPVASSPRARASSRTRSPRLHRASGLGDRFRLLGYRDDTTRLIAAADLFVLASHHEGLPVTVMEALTLGVPVVAPAVGGLPEVVERRRERDPRDPRLAECASPTRSSARSTPRCTRVSSTARGRPATDSRIARRGRAHRSDVPAPQRTTRH